MSDCYALVISYLCCMVYRYMTIAVHVRAYQYMYGTAVHVPPNAFQFTIFLPLLRKQYY